MSGWEERLKLFDRLHVDGNRPITGEVLSAAGYASAVISGSTSTMTFLDMEIWLNQHVTRGYLWGSGRVWFVDNEDAVLFKLVWS